MSIVTHAACMTPSGSGAIATIALVGPQAWECARSLFQPANSVPLADDFPPQHFRLGRFLADPGDEVVLILKQREPVPHVEFHCHGGREVVRHLLEVLADRGLTVCSSHELERTLAHDPLQIEAGIALRKALTTRTSGILLDQYHGALRRAFLEVRAALQAGNTPHALAVLDSLRRHAGIGRRLTQPFRVAVVGAPNVGKSSLVNALAGYQRSIVSPIPGTTRDVVSTLIAIDGWPVELLDTAGLHTATETLEQQGIALARSTIAEADLCLWILDVTADPVWPEDRSGNVRMVCNKIDEPAVWDLAQARECPKVSARTLEGVPQLCEALSAWLVSIPPLPGIAIPFTEELCALTESLHSLVNGGELEKAAMELATVLACK